VHPTIKGRKRFYKEVSVRVIPLELNEGVDLKYEVALDGRSLRTPGRRSMHFDSPELAWGVAAEWDAQVGKRGIAPSTMPLMSLTSTWLDQTAEQRDIVVRNVGKYLGTDTCCFYASPAILGGLRKKQVKAFTPLHEWMDESWDCQLATTDTVFRLQHPGQTKKRILAMVDALDSPALTALQCATMETKSLVMGLALVLRQITPSKAEKACRIEEDFQMDQWGLVEGGHDMDIIAGKVNLSSASAFLHLLDGHEGHLRRVKHLEAILAVLEP